MPWLTVEAPVKPQPIEEVLAELFGPPGTPRERSTRQAAANQFKSGARDAGISLSDQADRIRLAYRRYCESFDAVVTPHALVNHFGELVSDQHARRPTRLKRERVQRVTQYASQRVERDWSVIVNDADRDAGG